jgi:tRNA-specific 2-thiouridylase
VDVDDARAVADRLDIPFYVINCEEQFKSQVIEPFIQSYLSGKTPVPCVNCNTFLKFDHLIDKMKELDCEYLATGHYAQIANNAWNESSIFTSTDDWKDQTYFLFTLKKEILNRLIFPIGHLNKKEVRLIAEAKGLSVAKKKDSTGICFVGDRDYSKFIEEQIDKKNLVGGLIRRFPSGEALGRHSGIYQFTLGQSKGLGMTFHEKLFVIKLEEDSQTVWVGEEEHLFHSQLEIRDVNWLTEWTEGENLNVKIRYHHKGSSAQLQRTEEGRLLLQFDEPQRAITPGQAAVFYRERELVGGGWIV